MVRVDTDSAARPAPRMGVGRIPLYGGAVKDLITIDRAFIAAALTDALSWCHELEGPAGDGLQRTAGDPAEYEAALALLAPEPPGSRIVRCPSCGGHWEMDPAGVLPSHATKAGAHWVCPGSGGPFEIEVQA